MVIQILININTLNEIHRLLGVDLKRAGHTRYSESTKKLILQLKEQYNTEFSEESLAKLKTYHSQIDPLLENIEKNARNEEINEMVLRLRSEIDRLIHMQEKNLTPLL